MKRDALDGSTIYRSKGLTVLKDGKTNKSAFSGVLDDSLETIKLREIYAKHEAEIGYPYLEDKAFCRAIVFVSFDYAIKQYEKQGRRYVLYGQTDTDEKMTDLSLWEGIFYPRLPDGKRKKFNVYAKPREECEEALAKMIAEKKAEISAEKKKIKTA